MSETLIELSSKMHTMNHILGTHESRLAKMENILIEGEGDRLPLPEALRNLTNLVTTYIEVKNREEERSKAQWDKAKWIVLTVVITGGLTFAIQAIVFFVRIFPLLEKLAEVP